jgi:beta-galactosidase
MAAWDNYVGSGHLDAVDNGAMHDIIRGFQHKNFWLIETQPGFVNWSSLNNALNLGEARAMAWNAVGHGAEAVFYWQWRSALNGQEEYHGTLVGPDGTPVPFYTEATEIGTEFDRAEPVLAGTSVHSDVALLNDYNSRWAVEWQQHSKEFDYVKSLISFYRPLHQLANSVDIVSDTTPLSGYKLVVAPALNLLTPAAAANLEAYVRGGGHLVLGPRSGMKDEDNSLNPQRQPGPLVPLLGARVEQYYALDKPVSVSGAWGDGQSSIWAEQLGSLATDVQVLARYDKSNGWLDDQPAVVTRKVGNGRITYIGAVLDADSMSRAAAWMLKDAGVSAFLSDVPDGVDVAVRSGNGKHVLILTNYAAAARTVKLPTSMEDVLHGGQITTVTLAQYDVALLRGN